MLDGHGFDGLIGRSFGGFRVTRLIARGGMGVVFEGVQESLARPVAIKFLYPHLSDDDRFRGRFEREAWASSRLTHPNIVRVLDYGVDDGMYYMVQDLIVGESLRERLIELHSGGDTLRTDAVLAIVEPVGRALSNAHELGYVHRDVKPGNILLSNDGQTFLTDFGVVKIADASSLTSAGMIIGTPEYMAPEQSAGAADIGPAADQYSLGVVTYEMMVGRVPFKAPTPAAVMRMHLTDPPPPPRTVVPWFPEEVERVLSRVLAKEPINRFLSVQEFVEELKEAARRAQGAAGGTISRPPIIAEQSTTETRGDEPQTANPSATKRRPRLVGREREQTMLREQLERMLAGQGGTVLVGGEAGIGKTTLVEDLDVEAEGRGALVLWGHAYDLSVTPPYGPWLEIIRRYQGKDQGLPDVPAFVGNAEELARVGSQQTLFAEIAQFFNSAANVRPVVLVLDDLHWADLASLELFRFFARETSQVRILLIATYRSDELQRSHPLFTMLPLLVREARAERLEVRPLDEAGHHDLIQSRYALDEEDRRRLERYLRAHAEGNPLFASELLRTLEEDGVLVRTDDAWRLEDLEQIRVPEFLQQAIEVRINRLGDETGRLLEVAALIGQEVPLELWRQVSDVDETALLDVVEAAESMSVLEALPDGVSVRFRHALIRDALYERVQPMRRRVLHRTIAEVLVEDPSPDPDAVAYHFVHARDARAIQWLIKAGERAQQAYDWSTAAERFDAALTRLTEEEAPVLERAVLLWRVAMALRYADPSRALSLLQEAKNLATDAGNLGAASGFQLFSGSLKNNLGQHRSGISDMKQAVSVLESISNEERARIMSLAGVSDEPVEGTLIMWLASVGWVNEAVDRGEHFVLKTPVSVVHPGLGGSSYADGLAGLATANALLGRPQAARQAYLRAQSVYASIGHHNLVAHKGYDALELIYLRYFPDELASRQDLASSVTLAGRYVSGVAYGAPALFYSVPLSVVEGLWNDARETADQAYRSEGWWVHISGGYWLARLAACQGDSTLSWQIVSSLWPDGPQTKPGDFLIWIGLSLQRLAAELSLDAHDLSAARAWLTAHDRWLEWSGAVLGQADGNLLWSQYHDASGNQERARRHAEQALVQATEPRQPLALIAVHRFLGRIDAEQEQFEASAEHLNRSLALADACAAVFERALTLLEMAKLQASQGNRGQARTLLGEVRAICESLGAKPSLAKLTSLERTFDARGKASNT